jgi:phage terminase large subunit
MTPTASEIRSRIAADPLWFPRVVLGRTYWSRQADLYRALHASPRVASKGGHSTGKTHAAADFIVEYATTHPGAKVLLMGPKYDAVKVNLWAKVRAAFATARTPLGGKLGAESWSAGDEWWVRIAAADKPESLHLGHGPAMLVVIDEAVGVEPWAWEPINAMLASEGSRLVVLFNPTQSAHKTREICDDPAFRVVTLSCEDHPNVVSGSDVYPGAVTKAWVEEFRERVRKGLATADEYASRVKGDFPSGASDSLITGAELEACLTAEADDVPRLGLDVARFGSDRNDLVYVSPKREVRLVEEWSGQDLMFTAGRLMRAVRELGVSPAMTFVDSCGVGGGVVDRCREAGVYVQGVDAGEKATRRWDAVVGRETPFANRRAEMFWTLRCICKSVAVRIPRDFWADLGMIRVGYRGTDLAIRSKDDMRKEHGRSPDRADALALAFAAPAPRVWAVSG